MESVWVNKGFFLCFLPFQISDGGAGAEKANVGICVCDCSCSFFFCVAKVLTHKSTRLVCIGLRSACTHDILE